MSSAIKAAMSTLLDKYTLTGSNYIDWLRNVRIVLRTESLLHVLEEPVPDERPINAPQEQIDAFKKYMGQEAQVQGVLLASMSSDTNASMKI